VKTSILAVLALLVTATASHAVIIAGFTTATNDRFANDGSFIGSVFDWSGVGISSGGQWGTLVSNNVFLSSNHLHPGVSSNITFFSSNDPSGASQTRTVVSGQRIGTSDLWIGVLNTPVSTGVTSYSFISNDIADTAAFNAPSPVRGHVAYVVGKSPTAWATTLDVAVGRNVLDLWLEDVSAGGTTADSLVSLEGFTNDVAFETLVQGGDSGGPLFIGVGNNLVLTGINWLVGKVTIESAEYDISGYSYIGNYDTQISSFISANAVPESNTYGVIVGLIALAGATRRRKRQR
jgi:hypothetical protein